MLTNKQRKRAARAMLIGIGVAYGFALGVAFLFGVL